MRLPGGYAGSDADADCYSDAHANANRYCGGYSHTDRYAHASRDRYSDRSSESAGRHASVFPSDARANRSP